MHSNTIFLFSLIPFAFALPQAATTPAPSATVNGADPYGYNSGFDYSGYGPSTDPCGPVSAASYNYCVLTEQGFNGAAASYLGPIVTAVPVQAGIDALDNTPMMSTMSDDSNGSGPALISQLLSAVPEAQTEYQSLMSSVLGEVLSLQNGASGAAAPATATATGSSSATATGSSSATATGSSNATATGSSNATATGSKGLTSAATSSVSKGGAPAARQTNAVVGAMAGVAVGIAGLAIGL